MIAVCRLRYCPRTRAYAARRTAEGKTKREIIRCLKRYIARATFHALRADLGHLAESAQATQLTPSPSLRSRLHWTSPATTQPPLTSIGTSGGTPAPPVLTQSGAHHEGTRRLR